VQALRDFEVAKASLNQSCLGTVSSFVNFWKMLHPETSDPKVPSYESASEFSLSGALSQEVASISLKQMELGKFVLNLGTENHKEANSHRV